MGLFVSRGFAATTVQEIAAAAEVSRGTVFNYYPYKEAILLEHLARHLEAIGSRVRERRGLAALQALFDELGAVVEADRELVLPLGYELLNPDPERSRRAYQALPLTALLRAHLDEALADGAIRRDFSCERLARTLANAFFFTSLQWAAYRRDRPLRQELESALKLALEGIAVADGVAANAEPAVARAS